MTSLIGLAGRANAGKTTVAELISPNKPIPLRRYNNPWVYIVCILFGEKYDELVLQNNLLNSEAYQWTLTILKQLNPNIQHYIKQDFEAPDQTITCDSSWISLGFADPLKCICVPLSGLKYEILLGTTADARIMREQPIKTYVNDFWHPTMSGRQLLEIVGTDIFRANNDNFWIKLAQRRIAEYHTKGMGIIFSDIRFENEANMIRALGGKIWFICRDRKDLILTDHDYTTHVSKWKFLTFITPIDIILLNDSTIVELCKKIHLKIADS